MCTLIIGHGILGAGTMLVAANRDERPARASEPPRVLHEHPRVAGGHDAAAGGTWLAVRERRAVVAVLNRRDPARRDGAPDRRQLRSRGLLALDVASVRDEGLPLSQTARDHALAAIRRERYAPFSLVFLSPDGGWVISSDASDEPAATPIGPGWHVATHAALDDREEPRTQRLLGDLEGWTPPTLAAAEAGLFERLALHAGPSRGGPAVCIHEGPMVTVSASLVCLTRSEAHYRHLEGRPCEQRPTDRTALLTGDLAVARIA